MSATVTVVCWHCRASASGEFSRGPQFGFELADAAQKLGMTAYHDGRHGRVLVFCNADHARAEMTKAGTFRLRPKGIKAPGEQA